jgi:hypothetical protein
MQMFLRKYQWPDVEKSNESCIKDIRLMSGQILCPLRQELQGNNPHMIKLHAECLTALEIMMGSICLIIPNETENLQSKYV